MFGNKQISNLNLFKQVFGKPPLQSSHITWLFHVIYRICTLFQHTEYRGMKGKKKKQNKTIETMKAKQLKNFLIVNKSMKSKQLKNS